MIPEVNKEHAGQYVCVATNVAGAAEMMYEVEIVGKNQLFIKKLLINLVN